MGAHILGIVFVLIALFGIGFGIYILVADSVWMSAFGLPVEVSGVPKVLLGLFCFLPAILLVGLFWAMRREGGDEKRHVRSGP